MAWLSNPIAFTRGPVTFITTLVYLAIIIALIVVQTGVPPPPDTPTPIHGINLTEAWLDLQLLTGSHHPYNTHRNDAVHDWLLSRIESILTENNASSSDHTENTAKAYVFEDNISNLTFSSTRIPRAAGISVYFEGTNIIVYVAGTEDDKTQWWLAPNGKPSARNGVLVNAHYDSVSTGFGATDDGVGVVSVLQLARYFTTPGNKPKNGVVLLLNNGEEDFLNGANVFGQHPMSKLVSTFLNLEGAGAGGRAALFRSTDDAVTKAYANSKYPFGSSTTADGFNRGLVRSQTDYVVFNGILGYRGLDVAFIGPRARYHTDQDDSRHTGQGSLWHMLSAAVATTRTLTEASLTTNLDPGHTPGSPALWFDVFGRAFAVLQAHTFFALAVTLLVAGPIILILTLVLLYRLDKFYLFSGSRAYHMPDGDEHISLYGWRGFFRFPLISLVACATPIALAFLIHKENQYIAHSSEWAVWSMMISSFVFVAWFLSRAADFARPSSLTRAYGLSWTWAGWWVLLVVATVFEEHFHLVGTYFVLIYAASVFFSTWFAYLELFSLPKKSTYCRGKVGEEYFSSRSRSASRVRQETPISAPEDNAEQPEDDEEEPTERSSLLRSRGRSTFKGYRPEGTEASPSVKTKEESGELSEEQEWSKSQWTWLWLLQMILVVPINLIIVGQIGLLTTEGLHQTGQDGSSMFLVYIMIAACTILLFSPLIPILHRFTWHVPIFLLFVLIGTLIYNLTAFPFSPGNRVKLFFLQQVDLDAGNNSVSLHGVPGFLREAIASLPSTAGQELRCNATGPGYSLERCAWSGLPPNVATPNSATRPEKQYKSWLNYNVTRVNDSDGENKVRFVLYGRNTRACRIVFDSPISAFQVDGQAPRDKRFPPVPEAGSNEVRLWSRTWDRAWTVDVSWLDPGLEEDGEVKRSNDTLTGKVSCLWSDANQVGVIPAFDEAKHYLPNWVAITKADDGLVEGYKRFVV